MLTQHMHHFPTIQKRGNPDSGERGNNSSQNDLHSIFPTAKKYILLKRSPLPLMIKWAGHDGFEEFICIF